MIFILISCSSCSPSKVFPSWQCSDCCLLQVRHDLVENRLHWSLAALSSPWMNYTVPAVAEKLKTLWRTHLTLVTPCLNCRHQVDGTDQSGQGQIDLKIASTQQQEPHSKQPWHSTDVKIGCVWFSFVQLTILSFILLLSDVEWWTDWLAFSFHCAFYNDERYSNSNSNSYLIFVAVSQTTQRLYSQCRYFDVHRHREKDKIVQTLDMDQ